MLQMEDHSVRVYLPPVPDNAYASNLLYALLLRFIKASFVEGPRAAYLSINATKKSPPFCNAKRRGWPTASDIVPEPNVAFRSAAEVAGAKPRKNVRRLS